jgi:hypothetical protein
MIIGQSTVYISDENQCFQHGIVYNNTQIIQREISAKPRREYRGVVKRLRGRSSKLKEICLTCLAQ